MNSFWNKNASTDIQTPSQVSDHSSQIIDHLIIGAGLTGVSLAYWLRQKSPTQNTILLEARFSGYGASGRNAGFLTSGSLLHVEKMIEMWGEDFALSRLNITRAIRNYFAHKGWIRPEQKTGSLTLCSQKVSLERALKLYDKMNWPLKKRQLKTFHWAVFDESEYSIDPTQLLKNILASSGCPLITGMTVRSIVRDSQQNHWLVSADSIHGPRTFRAQSVYVATHTQIADLLPELAHHYTPTLNLIGLTHSFDHGVKQNTYVPELLCYFRPVSESQIIIGGLREKTGTLIERINRFISPLMDWKDIQLVEEWSGEIGLTEQPQPRAYSRGDGLYALGCYSGHGVALSFGAAHGFVQRIDSLTSDPQKFDVFTEPTLEYPT